MQYLTDANNPDIIWVRARRCKRCGGIITSDEAIDNGFGHHCLAIIVEEEIRRQQINGQECLFDEVDGTED